MFRFVRFTFIAPWVFAVLHSAVCAQAQGFDGKVSDPVFSGPQVGETLPAFKITSLAGESEGKVLDPITDAKGDPIVLVFVHELTRPGFGLMRAVTRFSAERKDKGVNVAVIFLTDDATATAKWSQNVKRLFSDDVKYGMFMNGKEGPGSYGLNRNVIVTVLVGNQGKVTGNFALVQPQLQVDGPAILESVAAISGGGKVPSMDELEAKYSGRSRMTRSKPNVRSGAGAGRGSGNMQRDTELATLLRRVINKQATAEDVRDAATKVEKYVAGNEKAQDELARIAATIVNSGRLENYGTAEAQKVLQAWCDKYKNVNGGNREKTDPSPESSPKEPSSERE